MTRAHGKNYRKTQQLIDRAWEVLADAGHVVVFGRPQVAHHFFTRIAADVWDQDNPPPVQESRTWPHGAERLTLDNGGTLTTASRESFLLGRKIDLLIQFEPTRYGQRAVEYDTEIIEIRMPEK